MTNVLLLALLLSALQLASAASFVTQSGSQLQVDGKPFYHVGFNAVWMPSSAAFGLLKRVDDTLDAAQRIGLNVVRVWGFNDAFPYAPGKYNVKQGQGLDYVIASAAQRGIRVELALANFWNAYMGPEGWMMMAYGKTSGMTVADFYRSDKILQLLKQHIQAVTSRVNTVTGVAYKDDPSIIGYNLFNEPRCPGCTADDMTARNAFISALASELRAAAPKQLTFSGTEGFFAAGDPNVGYNPGHGAQCEGEDWTSEIKGFQVATTHMYWRQMESFKQTGYERPGFEFYIQYLWRKLQLYTELAGSAGKPLVVEEFGLTKRFFTVQESKVVVAVVADALIAAKRAGKPFMGAWIWQAAPIGDPDVGGYDVSITKAPSGAFVGLGNPPKKYGTNKSPSELALSPTRWNGGFMNGTSSSPYDRAAAAGSSTNSGSTSGSSSNSTSSTTSSATAGSSSSSGSSSGSSSNGSSSANNGNSNNNGNSGSGGSSGSSGSSTSSGSSGSSSSGYTNRGPSVGNPASERAVVGRRMLDATGQLVVVQSDDVLDYFRQGDKRAACAVQVRNWPEASIPFELDVQAYMDMVSKREIVDILAEAARLLKE